MSFTGASNEWFMKNFCQDLIDRADSMANAYVLMNIEADQVSPGCGGLVFLPYMLGERSPIWDSYARGVFFGLSLHTTRKEMNRAILEGCGYGLRQLAEIAEPLIGHKITRFSSIGGGAKSQTWAQIKADITGKEIDILDMRDMAPVGAALLGGVGAGVFKDVFEASSKVDKKIFKVVKPSHNFDEVYDRRFEVYKSLYPALKDIFKYNLTGKWE